MAVYDYPRFTKTEVINAGRDFAQRPATPEQLGHALEVIHNWRASHWFPLSNLLMTLNRRARKIDSDSYAVQRVKRLESIGRKLKEFSSMRLPQMQDVGGCRAVLSNISDVMALREKYRKAPLLHELQNEKDYIWGEPGPKEDGYRGIHLVYEYKSREPGSAGYQGMLLEMQLRTKLQHIWATAVESASIFRKHPFKSRRGPEEWERFFVLVSHCFAAEEHCMGIPGCPENLHEAKDELRELVARHHFITTFQQYKTTIASAITQRGATHFFVRLDPVSQTVDLVGFKANETVVASERFMKQETADLFASGDIESMSETSDVALLTSRSIKELQRAYPNYFLDTEEFVARVQALIA